MINGANFVLLLVVVFLTLFLCFTVPFSPTSIQWGRKKDKVRIVLV